MTVDPVAGKLSRLAAAVAVATVQGRAGLTPALGTDIYIQMSTSITIEICLCHIIFKETELRIVEVLEKKLFYIYILV